MTGQYKIGLLIAIMLAPSVFGSVCTVMGYVSYDDGTNVSSGTSLSVADLDLGTVHDFTTGGKGWPVDNYFIKSFTCNWNDHIQVLYTDIEQTVKKSFRFDHYPYEINLVLARPTEEPIQTPIEQTPDSGSSGTSSGGGRHGGAPEYDFGVIVNESVNRIENNTRIRWYVINDTQDISMIIGNVSLYEDYVIIRFDTIGEVIFRLQEPLALDLNNDGKPDTKGTLIEIDGNDAYLAFDKIQQVPNDLVLPVEIEPQEEHPEAVPGPSFSRKQLSLAILGIVLAICFALVIIIDREHRKNA